MIAIGPNALADPNCLRRRGNRTAGFRAVRQEECRQRLLLGRVKKKCLEAVDCLTELRAEYNEEHLLQI